MPGARAAMSIARRAPEIEVRLWVMCLRAASAAPRSPTPSPSAVSDWSVLRRVAASRAAISGSTSAIPPAVSTSGRAGMSASSVSIEVRAATSGVQTEPSSAPRSAWSTSFMSLRTVSASSAPTASTNGKAAANSFVDSDRRRMAGISFRQFRCSAETPAFGASDAGMTHSYRAVRRLS